MSKKNAKDDWQEFGISWIKVMRAIKIMTDHRPEYIILRVF